MFRAYKRLLKQAGLPDGYRLHDLRHAMATAWLAAGENPKVVSERLGHASAGFTLQVYSHVLPHAQAEAAARMERLLGEGSEKGCHRRRIGVPCQPPDRLFSWHYAGQRGPVARPGRPPSAAGAGYAARRRAIFLASTTMAVR